ncbi:Nn.00g058440.m01.CDS01 [Neocucurbitaria sp. VM-36]
MNSKPIVEEEAHQRYGDEDSQPSLGETLLYEWTQALQRGPDSYNVPITVGLGKLEKLVRYALALPANKDRDLEEFVARVWPEKFFPALDGEITFLVSPADRQILIRVFTTMPDTDPISSSEIDAAKESFIAESFEELERSGSKASKSEHRTVLERLLRGVPGPILSPESKDWYVRRMTERYEHAETTADGQQQHTTGDATHIAEERVSVDKDEESDTKGVISHDKFQYTLTHLQG